MSSTHLEPFIPNEDLPAEFFMVLYGVRRSGKTTLLLHMLEAMKDRFKDHTVHIFTATGEINPAQWKNFPLSAVHTDVGNLDIKIKDLMDTQRGKVSEEVVRQIRTKRLRVPSPGEEKSDKGEGGIHRDPKMKPPKQEAKMGAEDTNPKGKKRRRTGVKKEEDTDFVGHKEKSQQNDLNRFPGEDINALPVQRYSDADIMRMRRSGLIDDTFMPRMLLIFDDVVSDEAIRHAPNLNKLAVLGRHVFMTGIVLSQCICGSQSVPPAIRINSDYVGLIGMPRSRNERKLMIEQYLTLNNDAGSTESAARIMSDTLTMEYRALMVNVTKTTAMHVRDYLFTFGPVPQPPKNVSEGFRLGTEEQWKEKIAGEREPAFTDKDKNRKAVSNQTNGCDDDGRFQNSMIDIRNPAYAAVNGDGTGHSRQFLDPFF